MKAICNIKICEQKVLTNGDVVIPFQYSIAEIFPNGSVEIFECDGQISDMSLYSPFVELLLRAREIANKNL